MTDKQKERLNQLCSQISKEKDHARFLQLVKELNELFEEKEQHPETRGHDDVMQKSEHKSA